MADQSTVDAQKNVQSKSYVFDLAKKNDQSTSKFTDENVWQYNSGWVVAFVRFAYRDTYSLSNENNQKGLETQTDDPLIIDNDCVSIRVSQSKGNPFGTLDMNLVAGKYDYLTMIAPGDFVFAFMQQDAALLEETIKKLKSKEAINDFNSGLKFFGRVEAVRMNLAIVNPSTGTKEQSFMITAHSFQEFATKTYSTALFGEVSTFLKSERLRDRMLSVVNESLGGKSSFENIQFILQTIISVYMGSGPGSIQTGGGTNIANKSFLLPNIIGKLFGISAKESQTLKFSDLLHCIFGIQNYGSNGFLPLGLKGFQSSSTQFSTPKPTSGFTISFADRFNDSMLWQVISTYTNTLINESFTTLRVNSQNKIMPFFIHRQIPFTSEKLGAANTQTTTRYLSVPRWKPHPSSVMNFNLGRTNALRTNFIQVTGSTPEQETGGSTSQVYQTLGDKNIRQDVSDQNRSGLRTFIVSSDLDQVTSSHLTRTGDWVQRISDWTINGHLKINGTITLLGISEPICVGDNLEFDGGVYHIEQINHSCAINSQGLKEFMTILQVSNGIRNDSTVGETKYLYMNNPLDSQSKSDYAIGHNKEGDALISDTPNKDFIKGLA